jgi:hypothetical protein
VSYARGGRKKGYRRKVLDKVEENVERIFAATGMSLD